ncbi:aminotransferase class V-fold PLP-dependent enzyme [Dactylosporangium sp. AC04546]|uniref:cysteine desulfurase family protein n=1 Tax=Dactylosporangium sp. AC04546 TaxID=2862460 RepID=UPI001EDE7001|nr:aminotransferase class V-fold PLP-dependent enzyme [Dactylosporangium sp. AC04546]WVK82229.1 aminotransferase class V-fold PLP-dependent enzyme [Dactylosporangium sp. AC04546]
MCGPPGLGSPCARRDSVAQVGVYFDSATATPLHPVARQAFQAAAEEGWADPGKLYSQARRARQLLDAARATAAEVLGVRTDELHFTAGGADAVRQAVEGVRRARGRRVVVHAAVEHSAVIKAAEPDAVAVPVSPTGRVDLDALGGAVSSAEVALAALQSANHEVGTVQPVATAAELCAGAGVPLLVDAAQSIGRATLPTGWSLLAGSARKWGGPAGVGVLAVRKGTRWERPWDSAADVPAIVAAAASLRAVHEAAAVESARQHALVDEIRRTVAATVPDVEVVGDPVERLPHIVTFSCLYVDGEVLLQALDRAGFAVSSGSACIADTLRPSHVLAAMGVLTHGNVRVSLHRDVSEEDVRRFLAVLPPLVAAARAEAGVAGL